ncbi:MAG: DUF599 family protein [Alphaproteobacteria bacterium]|nr:DUF599 family protein [Alphaproteobacteria bacterium]
MLPANVHWFDLAALAAFVACWIGYPHVIERLGKRPSINRLMHPLRRIWMARMLERDLRIPDTQILGFAFQSASFFASTTIIVIAALVSAFGALDRVHPTLSEISLIKAASIQLMQYKLLVVVVVVFFYALLAFTWALRQYNYLAAIIGAAPQAPVPEVEARAIAEALGRLMSSAVASVNAGMRAYYFAIAALLWFVHPLLFLGGTLCIVGMLAHRQSYSPAARAVLALAALCDRPPTPKDQT